MKPIEGSSPRVWGQGIGNVIMDFPERIIPTRMGTRKFVLLHACKHRDHPHAYGDKEKVKKAGFTNAGSSPRVWGQVADQGGELESRGIIPTRMGTSCPLVSCVLNSEDHPHAYGDKPL